MKCSKAVKKSAARRLPNAGAFCICIRALQAHTNAHELRASYDICAVQSRKPGEIGFLIVFGVSSNVFVEKTMRIAVFLQLFEYGCVNLNIIYRKFNFSCAVFLING